VKHAPTSPDEGPRIGLALAGGGVRGLAHVNALDVLDSLDIRPVAIAGTSIGAIIGALYASGKSAVEIREYVRQFVITKDDKLGDIYGKREELMRWLGALRPSFERGGLVAADRLLEHLLGDLKETRFEDLAIPLRVVATDFHRGEQVVIDSGELLPAIRASMSIPGVFLPFVDDDRVLVDGGVVNNLPYDQLPGDIDLRIAIDIAPTRRSEGEEMPKFFDMSLGMFDIMQEKMTAEKLRHDPPDVYACFRCSGVRMLDFGKIEDVWDQGGEEAGRLRCRLAEALCEGKGEAAARG